MKLFKISLVFLLITAGTKAWSWGGRGHDALCKAAVFLVKNDNLRSFLKKRPHIMGHLCNVPDVYWRNMGEAGKEGNYTHYFNREYIDIPFEKVPLKDYTSLEKKYLGYESPEYKLKISNFHSDIGSLWWRADQLFNLSVKYGKLIKKSSAPKGFPDLQNMSLPYNQGTYEMMVHMGLMGHFTGDISMPLHNYYDYDGYKAGHGGIHSFYEEEVVSEFGPDLVSKIVAKANQLGNPFKNTKSVLEKMRWMSIKFSADVEPLIKLDKVLKASEYKEEKGMKLKTPAQRPTSKEMLPVFEPMIINQMAHSSLLLAQLWDQIYSNIGKPDLSKYGAFKYPLQPDFVPVDYITSGK